MSEESITLSGADRVQIEEILRRRANEVASFKSDLEERVSTEAGKRIKLYELPGSVEMALQREVERLRRLAEKIAVPKRTEEDD